MGKKKKTIAVGSYPEPSKLSFPEDESRHDWLKYMVDAYHAADICVAVSIGEVLKKGGRKLACTKGCSTCCKTHTTIPVYPLELLGIYWYVIEKISGDIRNSIQQQLEDFSDGSGCPFLVNGACGIHQVRPMACRFFNVFGKQCDEGEDPFYTRRSDVLTPLDKYKDKAVSLMLPYHGIIQRTERREAMKSGYIHQFVRNLHEINWAMLSIRMDTGELQL